MPRKLRGRRRGKKRISKVMDNALKVRGFKKYNSGCILGGSLSFPFPPRLRTLLRTVINGAVTNALAGTDGNAQDLFFKLNSVIVMGPCDNAPLGTAGSFAANYPSGVYYLLANDVVTSAGPSGIYGRYLVRSSSIKFEYSTEATANKACEIVIRPFCQTTSFAMTTTTSQVSEQPHAKTWICPPVLNEYAKKMTHSISVKKLYGLTSLDTSDADFCGLAYNADPTEPAFWQVRLKNLDNSTTSRLGSYRCTIVQEVEFFDINVSLTTSAPA